MKDEQLSGFRRWFEAYVRSFYGDDARLNAHLDLKHKHTAHVCAEMKHLTKQLGLGANERRLAQVIALFHDVGRFEQVARYGTFMDARSENHALLGLRVLRENRILDQVAPTERRIIETAIEVHGAKQLPADLPEDCVMYTRLIRDADKLDIYRVVLTSYREYRARPEGFVLDIPFPDDDSFTPAVLQGVLDGRHIDYTELRTMNDVKLMQLGWIYDINFVPSLERLVVRGHLDELFSLLGDGEQFASLKDRVREHIRQALGRT